MTRQDYMQGRVTFAEYYRAIARVAGIRFAPDAAFKAFGDCDSLWGRVCVLKQAVMDAAEGVE